jgi:signal transduction histidine kinase
VAVGSLRTGGLVILGVGAVAGGSLPAVLAESGAMVDPLAVALAIASYVVVAVIILLARPGHRVGRLMLTGGAAWGLGEALLAVGIAGWPEPTLGTPPAQTATVAGVAAIAGIACRGAGWLTLILGLPLIFPDGQTAWPRRRAPGRLAVASVGSFVLGTVLSPTPLETRLEGRASPTGLSPEWSALADLLALGGLLGAAVALTVALVGLRTKLRRADELARQQLIWFAVAFAAPLPLLLLVATPWAQAWMFALVAIPVPIAVGVAVLQRRLYDIELVVSRSLTYVLLSVVATALYAATIVAVGAFLRRRGEDWLPWVGAGVVAVAFAPLRDVLQRVANRVVYGHWAAPADVLAATGRRLRDASDLSALLDTLVHDLGDTMGLRRVELADRGGRILAQHGDEARDLDELSLTAYGRPVGTLRWARTSLRPRDRAMLARVGEELGAALHAAGLIDDLRGTQERLVIAREEERKRLRRDLHDGLGPSLAGLTLDVDTLRNRLRTLDAHQTDAQLLSLRTGIQSAVAEVRRVVEGLRPPALDELGLGAALDHLAQRLTDGTRVVVDLEVTGLEPLPAAAEVAVYRVAQEALTNVVHHSGAQHVRIRVATVRERVVLEVADDGHGRPAPRDGGVGLGSMRERAEELGGTLEIVGTPGSGTTIRAAIPLVSAVSSEVRS